jgi:hypothetical protein
LFELCELEGEDLALKSLCSAFGIEVPRELRELKDLPPRIALAIAYMNCDLRPLLREAASEVLREKVRRIPLVDRQAGNKKRVSRFS